MGEYISIVFATAFIIENKVMSALFHLTETSPARVHRKARWVSLTANRGLLRAWVLWCKRLGMDFSLRITQFTSACLSGFGSSMVWFKWPQLRFLQINGRVKTQKEWIHRPTQYHQADTSPSHMWSLYLILRWKLVIWRVPQSQPTL